MAEISHRPSKLLAPIVPLLIAPTHIDNILIFLKIFLLLSQKIRTQGKLRQNVPPVQLIPLDLIEHLHRILQHLRMVREQRRHLLLALKIFLLGITHPLRIIKRSIAVHTDKPVMSLPVLLPDKMRIIRRHHLRPRLLSQLKNRLINLHLPLIKLQRHPRHLRPMQLHLQIIIIPEHPLMPLNRLFRPVQVPRLNAHRHLTGHTSRAADKILRIFLNHLM